MNDINGKPVVRLYSGYEYLGEPRCDQCKHFKPEQEYPHFTGVCQLGYGHDSKVSADVSCGDYGDCVGVLRVADDFGCVLWEEKE